MRTGSLAVAFSLFVAACGGSSEPTVASSNNPPDGPGITPIDTSSTPNLGPQTTGFVDKTMIDGGVTYKYKVFVPANYNSVSKVPVLLALHASEEKGSDNVSQTMTGVGRIIRASPSTFPAITVFPQAPAGEGPTFATFVRLGQIALRQTLSEYGKRDLSRVYLTGHSYGALAGYNIAYLNPTVFAAFMPISGYICGGCILGAGTDNLSGAATVAAAIKTLPIWQFQGDQDASVSVTLVRQQVDILKAAGSPILYEEKKGGDHAIWDGIYLRADVWNWLWAQHR